MALRARAKAKFLQISRGIEPPATSTPVVAPVAAVDRAKYDSLKSQWATVNNGLLANIDKPDSPEAQG